MGFLMHMKRCFFLWIFLFKIFYHFKTNLDFDILFKHLHGEALRSVHGFRELLLCRVPRNVVVDQSVEGVTTRDVH